MSKSDATNLPAVITDTTVSDAANITRRCVGARMHRAIVETESIRVFETFGRTEDDESVCRSAPIVERYGLPGRIIVAPDHTLLAGYHSLAVAKKLRWPRVEVSIVEDDE